MEAPGSPISYSIDLPPSPELQLAASGDHHHCSQFYNPSAGAMLLLVHLA